MEGSLTSKFAQVNRKTGLLVAGMGLVGAAFAGLAGWLYFELDQTQRELSTTAQALANTEVELEAARTQSAALNDQVSSLEEKNSGLEAEVNSMTQIIEQTTQDLENQEVVAECMTAIVGAIAVAESERQLYVLLSPYVETCDKAIELMES